MRQWGGDQFSGRDAQQRIVTQFLSEFLTSIAPEATPQVAGGILPTTSKTARHPVLWILSVLDGPIGAVQVPGAAWDSLAVTRHCRQPTDGSDGRQGLSMSWNIFQWQFWSFLFLQWVSDLGLLRWLVWVEPVAEEVFSKQSCARYQLFEHFIDGPCFRNSKVRQGQHMKWTDKTLCRFLGVKGPLEVRNRSIKPWLMLFNQCRWFMDNHHG